ncbi:MAG: hypothetical protein ABSF43_15405 [Rectinemataceae bacterium]|jgi:hypothetical protein
MEEPEPKPVKRYGPSMDEFKEESRPRVITPLPDINQLIENTERSVLEAETVEIKTGYIDVGIKELIKYMADGKDISREAERLGAVDEPDVFGDFDTAAASAIRHLKVLRARIILEGKVNAKRTVTLEPQVRSISEPSSSPKSSPPSPPSPQEDPNWKMNRAANYLGMGYSEFSKHYKEWGVPYTTEGGIRFNKESLDAWRKSREKNGCP